MERKTIKISLIIIFLGFSLSIFGQESIRMVEAQEGDTVATIAKRYSVDDFETAKLNGLLPISKVPAGKRIKIPIKKTTSVKPCFSESEIKLDIEQLPPSYYGHDLSVLINEILRRENIKKDEFETTKQFQDKIQAENNKPLLGNLIFTSLYAFQGEGDFKYDADREEMNVSFALEKEFSWEPHCQESYRGTRKYGFRFKDSRDNRTIEGFWQTSFPVDIPTAKKTKPSLHLLFITSITKDNQNNYFENDENSFSSRNFFRVLNTSLKEIWVYDISTGKIWKKDKFEIKKLEVKPKKAEVLNFLKQARTFYYAGNNDEALIVLRRLLSIEPMDDEAYLLMGLIHLRRADLDQAISSLKTALFWNIRLIDAHIALGRIYLKKGDCLQAQNYSRSALEISSENTDALALQREVARCSR